MQLSGTDIGIGKKADCVAHASRANLSKGRLCCLVMERL